MISQFWTEKYKKESSKSWNLFYKRNTTKFFKDRHWTEREFPELALDKEQVLLEVGCGVGNFMLPLVSRNPRIRAIGCDFAANAVDLLKGRPEFDPQRCSAFVCDITKESLLLHLEKESCDLVSCIFVLSAVHPDDLQEAAANIVQAMKPGGILMFRDYAVNDGAQSRFKKDRQISEKLFVRQDGTFSSYFDEQSVVAIFQMLKVQSIEIVERKTKNFKEGIELDRLFVQARFIKE